MERLECLQNEAKGVEKEQEDRVLAEHRSDSVTLLLYTVLLILSVLTIWLFKHRRFRYFHETGLSVIYGLIVGAIIRYASHSSHRTIAEMTLPPSKNESCIVQLPPNRVLLNLVVTGAKHQFNQTLHYVYSFNRQIKRASLGSVSMEEKATFDPEIFFNLLLPPIIFCAGYSMKRKQFFQNLGAIMTYAFIGTISSALIIGAISFGLTRLMPWLKINLTFSDCLFFGSIISATDPVTVLAIFNDMNVDVDLYALVFGESILNDAVAIVLSQAVEKYGSLSHGSLDGYAILSCMGTFLAVFGGAFAIGSSIGCMTALLTKYTYIRDHPLLETALFCLTSYSTFLAAEAAGFTGIVAVLFCGITQAHYTYNNLSPASQTWTKELFELLNFLSENFVFTYIGVSTFTFRQHNWDPGFISVGFLAIIVARGLNIYPLTFFLNLGRTNKIDMNKQHMLMFCGLRGAMAFSLAIRNTSTEIRKMFFSTTLVITIATVLVCGCLSTPMLQWLKIRVGVDSDQETRRNNQYGTSTATQRQTVRRDDSMPETPVIEPLPFSRPSKAFLVRIWSGFDSKFLKPLLTHSGPLLSDTLPQCCYPLAALLTTTEQLSACVATDSETGPESSCRPVLHPDDDDLMLAYEEVALGPPVRSLQLEDEIGGTSSGSVQRPTSLEIGSGLVNPVFTTQRGAGQNGGFGDPV